MKKLDPLVAQSQNYGQRNSELEWCNVVQPTRRELLYENSRMAPGRRKHRDRGPNGIFLGEVEEIIYIELPEVGDRVNKDQAFGVIENVKEMSDLIAPVSGTVIGVNDAIFENPSY